jgi:mevalonate kinase
MDSTGSTGAGGGGSPAAAIAQAEAKAKIKAKVRSQAGRRDVPKQFVRKLSPSANDKT